jgi:hypothetical protein
VRYFWTMLLLLLLLHPSHPLTLLTAQGRAQSMHRAGVSSVTMFCTHTLSSVKVSLAQYSN